MKVLVVGGGAREHALGWKLTGDGCEVVSAPGNPGLAALGPTLPEVAVTDTAAIVEAAVSLEADLVVVGPEAPLAAGVADALADKGVLALGPGRAGALLESSKSHAKDVMARAGVPTAAAAVFTSPDRAIDYLADHEGPFVVKADGLAGGKGVLVTLDRAEAENWTLECFGGRFGPAGNTVVIEEHLSGRELSVIALCADGDAVALAPARDYKRLRNDDAGPNTGGMGGYSPVGDAPAELTARAIDEIVRPVLTVLESDGITYRGFLYAGLILTDGGIRVLEFNVRLGDPEAQVLLPRLDDDLGALLAAAAAGELPDRPLRWSSNATLGVVLAAPGYPDRPHTGEMIRGLGTAAELPAVHIFHAGTSMAEGVPVTAGGRVVNVVGTGVDLSEARRRAYDAASVIDFPGKQFRTDIGLEVSER